MLLVLIPPIQAIQSKRSPSKSFVYFKGVLFFKPLSLLFSVSFCSRVCLKPTPPQLCSLNALPVCPPKGSPQYRMQSRLLSGPENDIEKGVWLAPIFKIQQLCSTPENIPQYMLHSCFPWHSWPTSLQFLPFCYQITSFPCLILKAFSHCFLLDSFNFILHSTLTDTSCLGQSGFTNISQTYAYSSLTVHALMLVRV